MQPHGTLINKLLYDSLFAPYLIWVAAAAEPGAGVSLSIANAFIEYKNGTADTQTFVNLGIAAVGVGVLIAGSSLAAPVVVGIAAVTFGYGLLNAGGYVDTIIDEASGHRGRKAFYGR